MVKNTILEEVICYRIPIPTRQDGVENRDKAYSYHTPASP